MLQPRIALRPAAQSCNCLLSSLRSYATATTHTQTTPVQPVATNPSIGFAPPSMAPREKTTFQMKTYKPRTPGVRHLRRTINEHLWKGGPHKPLTFAKVGQGKGGRNHTGRVTVRHRGGGHRRRIRTVDFVRMAPGKHTVDRIEYDPNRSAHIALVTNEATKTKSYIIAAEGMRAGTQFRAIGRAYLRICWIVYNVGSTAGKGGVFCRSAGTFATVIAREEVGKKIKDVIVRLQSGEVRKVSKDACATVGVASNPLYHFQQLGKAGRSRWLNIRPTVRGVAMNAVDHPHGGGRGKSKGNVHPVSPWGVPAKGGYKTRKKSNTNIYVVQERVRNMGKRRKTKT
ncbi:mitochondrial 54S ribosomal protein rml2 [Coniosporium tulheliwenetii]|uniref:Mitochondrial 54S ribosomal protein rml2 n=1 Tax=Coniosporium tulheliwenetii TaxID=3383036 RepID=A0ACC2ZK16_9PEZI|nr:mitochondrial 54S ribosomal protein rml2 [Cladosporium sp. JES 115]